MHKASLCRLRPLKLKSFPGLYVCLTFGTCTATQNAGYSLGTLKARFHPNRFDMLIGYENVVDIKNDENIIWNMMYTKKNMSCIYVCIHLRETPSPLLLSSCTEQNISDLLCHLIEVALLTVHGARQSWCFPQSTVRESRLTNKKAEAVFFNTQSNVGCWYTRSNYELDLDNRYSTFLIFSKEILWVK